MEKTLIQGTIIKYPTSDNGKAYRGVAKEPLMKTPTNIGYLGVKIQNTTRTLIQCFECGKWVSFINSAHLQMHGMDAQKYKKKFGFNQNTALTSDSMNTQMAKNILGIGNVNADKKWTKRRLLAVKRANALGLTRHLQDTIEFQNKYGTCEEQLKARLVEFVHRYHRLPWGNSKYDGFNFQGVSTYKRRFGSLNEAFQHYGLPWRVKYRGKTFCYKFPDKTIFTLRPGDDYGVLYQLMLKKCSVLKNYIPKSS